MNRTTETSHPSPAPPRPTGLFTRRTLAAFGVEGLASISANLLLQGFFFYATAIFHWTRTQSFGLASAEGVLYVLGALGANHLSRRIGRRSSLILLQAIMVGLTAASAIRPTQMVVCIVLLGYTMASAAQWPNLEGVVSSGVDADLLSRRIGVYNLVWSGINALTTAAVGTLIVSMGAKLFYIPVAVHLLALGILLMLRVPPEAPAAHPQPEPALLGQRKLAMHLSRIALPSTYTVIYALTPMLPTLAVIRSFSPQLQTVVASTWMVARFVIFLILSATAWWHTRPRMLMWAAVIMLGAFLGVVLRPADLLGHPMASVTQFDQLSMILWQMVLGGSMGMIYAGSLYFGMVLSDGSVEHGGYHEALIGLGQVIGPGAGVIAEQFAAGNSNLVVAAVGGVIAITVLGAAAVTIKTARDS